MCGLSDSQYSALFILRRWFFSKKRMKDFFCLYSEIYAYLRQNAWYQGLNVQKFEICGQSIFKVIEVFNTVRTVLYIGCSGPMIRCSCTQSSGLDKRELYAYVAGCPCYIWASTCVLGYMLHFRPTKTQASLCRVALAFVTNIHKVWMKIKTRNKIWTSSPTRRVKSL